MLSLPSDERCWEVRCVGPPPGPLGAVSSNRTISERGAAQTCWMMMEKRHQGPMPFRSHQAASCWLVPGARPAANPLRPTLLQAAKAMLPTATLRGQSEGRTQPQRWDGPWRGERHAADQRVALATSQSAWQHFGSNEIAAMWLGWRYPVAPPTSWAVPDRISCLPPPPRVCASSVTEALPGIPGKGRWAHQLRTTATIRLRFPAARRVRRPAT